MQEYTLFDVSAPSSTVDIPAFGGRLDVSWNPGSQVTQWGGLAYFTSYLKTSGLFDRLVEDAPFRYSSPNAPEVRDVVGTVKPVFGHQEGAEPGYNPQKPGRPSHNFHSYFIGSVRISLGVDVQPGKRHSGGCGMPRLWEIVDALPPEKRPRLIRGDVGYGGDGAARAARAPEEERARARPGRVRLRRGQGRQVLGLLRARHERRGTRRRSTRAGLPRPRGLREQLRRIQEPVRLGRRSQAAESLHGTRRLYAVRRVAQSDGD